MRHFIASIALAVAATGAEAASVDFEGLSTAFLSPSETIDGFTFNAQGGSSVRIFNDNPNPRTTYVLACVPGDCENALEIVFPNVTDNFAMNVVSDSPGGILDLAFQTAGGVMNFVVNTFDGDGDTKDFLTFAGLNGATSVWLTPTDPSGFGYDDIRIDMSQVPVPAGLPMLVMGLGGLALLRRKAG